MAVDILNWHREDGFLSANGPVYKLFRPQHHVGKGPAYPVAREQELSTPLEDTLWRGPALILEQVNGTSNHWTNA
ncbi:MAG: hypothetical protein ACREC9_04415 [Methylocella sp.]